MDILKLSSSEILKIKPDHPEKLFSGSESNIKRAYRKLSIQWHPDKNKGNSESSHVFAHLHALYQEALRKLSNGTLGTHENALLIKDLSGKQFVFRYLKKRSFEMGDIFIAHNYVMWRFDIEYKDTMLSGLNNIAKIKYADSKMEKSFKPYIPEIVKVAEEEENVYVVLAKDKNMLSLADIHSHYNGRIDPRHTAWILSTLYNNICFVHFNNLMHGGLTLDNYFINPETHEGMILGGWWYSKPENVKLQMLSLEAIDVAPLKLINTKEAQLLLDLEMIKKMGRQLLGDATGTYLHKDTNIPEALVKWLRDGSKGTAVEQYSEWNKTVLPKSFGARSFTVMNVKSDDLYSEV